VTLLDARPSGPAPGTPGRPRGSSRAQRCRSRCSSPSPVLVVALVALVVALNVAVAAVAKVTAVVLLPSVLAVVALLGALRPLVRRGPDTSYGMEVGPADEPALWSLVREVAAEAGTAPPDVVVLTPGTDASVHDETLLLGLVRRRRVLTRGLALLSLVDVAQLRAVLAHEHGHYAAGDTRLSALTHRTREAVERAAAEMGPGLLGRVFGWYRERHVRLTEASGRSQELAADVLSARVAGPAVAAEALLASAASSVLFRAYLDEHVGSARGSRRDGSARGESG
jgi:Zn-dependent protease with chaperone function